MKTPPAQLPLTVVLTIVAIALPPLPPLAMLLIPPWLLSLTLLFNDRQAGGPGKKRPRY